MRLIFVMLSIALIFVGIAAVLYVDAKSQEEKSKKEVITESNSHNRQVSDNFEPKQSMKEIDSITSAYNYHFTVDNAVQTAASDSSKKAVNSKKM